MLNGVEVVSIGGGDESGSSNSILLALNRYDEVWLQLMQGSLTESKDRSRTGMTSFSGYRSDLYRVLVLERLGIQLRTGKNMSFQNGHPIQ